VTETEVAPGRPNVVGVLEGAQPGPTLLLCGHLDTVGVEGMDEPFTPVEREGRLYGRGTQDMKSGLAACVGAARLLASAVRILRTRAPRVEARRLSALRLGCRMCSLVRQE